MTVRTLPRTPRGRGGKNKTKNILKYSWGFASDVLVVPIQSPGRGPELVENRSLGRSIVPCKTYGFRGFLTRAPGGPGGPREAP